MAVKQLENKPVWQVSKGPCITHDKHYTHCIMKPYEVLFRGRAPLSRFLDRIGVNIRSSFYGWLGLPENPHTLRGTWKSQLNAHSLVQSRRDWDLPNSVFGVNV